MTELRFDRDRSLYGITFSIAAVLTGPFAALSTIAMPITPYDTLVYLLMPSLAAVMTIRWARRTSQWSWLVLVTHQIVLSALYLALYFGLWILLFMAAWGGGYVLIAVLSLPLVVLVERYLRARSLARAEPTSSRRAISTGLGVTCLAYAAYAAYQYGAIVRSESDSAFLAGFWDFLLIAPIVLLGSFAAAWSAATLINKSRRPSRWWIGGSLGLLIGAGVAALYLTAQPQEQPPTPDRTPPAPTLDEVIAERKAKSGLTYRHCGVWDATSTVMTKDPSKCMKEAFETCTPAETLTVSRGGGGPGDILRYASLVEPRDDGSCVRVVVFDSRNEKHRQPGGCDVRMEECHHLGFGGCQVIKEWGCLPGHSKKASIAQ